LGLCSHEPRELFPLSLELGAVLRDLNRACAPLLEQRANEHESLDVQEESVDLAFPRKVSGAHGVGGVASVGTGIAASQMTANAEPSLANAAGTAPVEVVGDPAKGRAAASISWIVVAGHALSVIVPV